MSEDEIDPLRALIEAGSRRVSYTPPTPTTERFCPALDEQEYRRWLTPEAMIAAMPYGISNYEQIGRELRADRYKAAADEVIWAYNGKTGRDKFAQLYSWVWAIAMPEPTSDFWRTGYLDTTIAEAGSYNMSAENWVRIYGVRFWSPNMPETRAALTGTEANGPAARRGAKRKDWWDHLWIEMIQRIESGTLDPSGPTELQQIMLDWLGEQGIFPGEDTLKKTASNLFKYLDNRRGK